MKDPAVLIKELAVDFHVCPFYDEVEARLKNNETKMFKFILAVVIVGMLVAGFVVWSNRPSADLSQKIRPEKWSDFSPQQTEAENSSATAPPEQSPQPITALSNLPEAAQKSLESTAKQAEFAAFIPTQAPKGFVLGGPGSSGQENGVQKYFILFKNSLGDNLQINQYGLSEYLSANDTTLNEIIGGTAGQLVGNRTVYLPKGYTINSRRLQYVQGASFIESGTIVSFSYFGSQKLSDEELLELAGSFRLVE